jgi:hypothetical protein
MMDMYRSKTFSFFPFEKGDLFELIQFPVWWDEIADKNERLYIGDIILVMEEPYEPTESYKKLYEEFPEFGLVAKAIVLNRQIEILLITVKEGSSNLELISKAKCEH